MVSSVKLYIEALTNNSTKDDCNVKMFCNSIPKGIRINQWIKSAHI